MSVSVVTAIQQLQTEVAISSISKISVTLPSVSLSSNI